MGKQISRKKRIIIIVCAAAFVAAAAAILLGVLLTQLPKHGDNPAPQVGTQLNSRIDCNSILIPFQN